MFENNKNINGTSDLPSNDPFSQNINMFDTPVQQTPASSAGRANRRSARKSVATNFSDIEFNEAPKKRKRTAGPKVNYVKPMKKKSRARATKFEWTWGKLCWMLCGLLVLRLIFMENGIIDYYSMKETLQKKEYDLQMIRNENVNLMSEIHKIRTSPKYQKKVARDHLGVIAKGEYLVLFSSDRAKNF